MEQATEVGVKSEQTLIPFPRPCALASSLSVVMQHHPLLCQVYDARLPPRRCPALTFCDAQVEIRWTATNLLTVCGILSVLIGNYQGPLLATAVLSKSCCIRLGDGTVLNFVGPLSIVARRAMLHLVVVPAGATYLVFDGVFPAPLFGNQHSGRFGRFVLHTITCMTRRAIRERQRHTLTRTERSGCDRTACIRAPSGTCDRPPRGRTTDTRQRQSPTTTQPSAP